MICAITCNDVLPATTAFTPFSRPPSRSRSCAIRVCGFRDVTMVAHYRLAIGPLLPVRESRNGPYRVRRGVIPGRNTASVVTRPFSTDAAGHQQRRDTVRTYPGRFAPGSRNSLADKRRGRSAIHIKDQRCCAPRKDAAALQYKRVAVLIAILIPADYAATRCILT